MTQACSTRPLPRNSSQASPTCSRHFFTRVESDPHMRRSQGRTKIRAHQSSGASRASRHGPARYFSFRSLQGTRHRARHSLPICRSQRRAQRPWKACSRTYVATRFFSQVEPPPRFIRKLKEPPLNRTNIFFGESHSDWLPVRGGESGDFVFRRGDGHAFAKIAPASRRGELAGERDGV